MVEWLKGLTEGLRVWLKGLLRSWLKVWKGWLKGYLNNWLRDCRDG